MSAKHTTGRLSVVIESTCSGAWASIVENCTDPKTGEAWQRELGETGTVFVEKSTSARGPNGEYGGYDEAPGRFKKTKNHAEFMANAVLWASAHKLLAALIVARDFIRTDRQSLADCSMRHDGTFEGDDKAALNDYDSALKQIDQAITDATGGAA